MDQEAKSVVLGGELSKMQPIDFESMSDEFQQAWAKNFSTANLGVLNSIYISGLENQAIYYAEAYFMKLGGDDRWIAHRAIGSADSR